MWFPTPNYAHLTYDYQNVGWVGFIRVDGELYGWLGVGNDNKTTTLATYVTPTQTILQLRTGPVDMTVTFLSPVEVSATCFSTLPPLKIFVFSPQTGRSNRFLSHTSPLISRPETTQHIQSNCTFT